MNRCAPNDDNDVANSSEKRSERGIIDKIDFSVNTRNVMHISVSFPLVSLANWTSSIVQCSPVFRQDVSAKLKNFSSGFHRILKIANFSQVVAAILFFPCCFQRNFAITYTALDVQGRSSGIKRKAQLEKEKERVRTYITQNVQAM